MEHRGYTGTVEYDAVDGIFHGRVEHLRDTITYEADCLQRLASAFRDSIDTYIEACLSCEEAPEPPPSIRRNRPHPRTQRGPGDALSRPVTVVILSCRCASARAAMRLRRPRDADARP